MSLDNHALKIVYLSLARCTYSGPMEWERTGGRRRTHRRGYERSGGSAVAVYPARTGRTAKPFRRSVGKLGRKRPEAHTRRKKNGYRRGSACGTFDRACVYCRRSIADSAASAYLESLTVEGALTRCFSFCQSPVCFGGGRLTTKEGIE